MTHVIVEPIEKSYGLKEYSLWRAAQSAESFFEALNKITQTGDRKVVEALLGKLHQTVLRTADIRLLNSVNSFEFIRPIDELLLERVKIAEELSGQSLQPITLIRPGIGGDFSIKSSVKQAPVQTPCL